MSIPTRTLPARLHDTGGQPLPGGRLIAQVADSRGRPRAHFVDAGSIHSTPIEATSGADGVAALYLIRVVGPDGAELSRTTIEMPDEDKFLSGLGV